MNTTLLSTRLSPLLFSLASASALALALAIASAGCTAPTGEPADTASDESALATASADHACQVVLRTARVRFDEPFVTDASGAPWFAVDATVDVAAAALAHGASPAIQWGPGGTSPRTTRATDDAPIAIAGAPSGFQRFAFRLTHDTIPANGQDETALSESDVALIPLLVEDHGKTKVFDHNRRPGATDQYALFLGNGHALGSGFEVVDDPRVCR